MTDSYVHMHSGHISFVIATSERHHRPGRKEAERALLK